MRRRGISFLEMTVAGILLVALMALCLQMFGLTARLRSATRQRQAAVEEADNLLERLAARPWEELTPEAVGRLGLSPQGRSRLPGGELHVEVDTPPQEPAAKRIRVSVRWRDGRDKWLPPIRLVAWKYQDTGGD